MSEAAEQLCLDVENPEPEAAENQEIDLVDAVLSACGGDARVAIRELLADTDFLRDQLYTASTLMSRGMAYGWRPRYERV
jgi:hypothetical protein